MSAKKIAVIIDDCEDIQEIRENDGGIICAL
jgi:hypothetical protein